MTEIEEALALKKSGVEAIVSDLHGNDSWHRGAKAGATEAPSGEISSPAWSTAFLLCRKWLMHSGYR